MTCKTPQIDWDPVYAVIEAAKVPDWDREGIGNAVVAAYKHWTEGDQSEFRTIGVELVGDLPFPYRVDLVQQDYASDEYCISDWKTKKDGKKLDERWALRERRSLQHRLYAAAAGVIYGPDIFPVEYEVRGISLEESPVVKSVTFDIDYDAAQEAVRDLESTQVLRDSLITLGRVPWPRYESGCQCFGPMYECEFAARCWGDEPVPDGWGDGRRLSYSSRKEFARCPERYRLQQVLAGEEDEDRTAAGTAFHAAMEQLYKQLL